MIRVEKQTKNFVCVDCGRLFVHEICYIVKNKVVHELCKECFEIRKKKTKFKE